MQGLPGSTPAQPDGRTVSVIAGDGIGPEVLAATLQVLDAAGTPLRYEPADAGTEVVTRYGTNLPPGTIESVRRNGVALKGPTATEIAGGLASANVALRKALDLYSSLRPVKSFPGVESR